MGVLDETLRQEAGRLDGVASFRKTAGAIRRPSNFLRIQLDGHGLAPGEQIRDGGHPGLVLDGAQPVERLTGRRR